MELGPEYTFHPETGYYEFFEARNIHLPDIPLLERLYDIEKRAKYYEKL